MATKFGRMLTYLDQLPAKVNNNRISIDGYNLIRTDHPSHSKRVGVCIYYKEYIPLIKRDEFCALDNCLMTEIRLQGEKCFLICVYCSQGQSHVELDNFCTQFDLFLRSTSHDLMANCQSRF